MDPGDEHKLLAGHSLVLTDQWKHLQKKEAHPVGQGNASGGVNAANIPDATNAVNVKVRCKNTIIRLLYMLADAEFHRFVTMIGVVTAPFYTEHCDLVSAFHKAGVRVMLRAASYMGVEPRAYRCRQSRNCRRAWCSRPQWSRCP